MRVEVRPAPEAVAPDGVDLDLGGEDGGDDLVSFGDGLTQMVFDGIGRVEVVTGAEDGGEVSGSGGAEDMGGFAGGAGSLKVVDNAVEGSGEKSVSKCALFVGLWMFCLQRVFLGYDLPLVVVHLELLAIEGADVELRPEAPRNERSSFVGLGRLRTVWLLELQSVPEGCEGCVPAAVAGPNGLQR